MYTHASGIILAGVHQWRASAFERWVPRTLVPIANRPLVAYPLSWLRDGGADGVRICANSDTQALRACLGNGDDHGVNIEYYEDHMPRGPAGCVADATREIEGDHFLVVEGCVIPQDVNIHRLMETHAESGAALTVTVTGGADASRLAPAGVYVFSRSALEHVGESGYEDIKEMLIPRLHTRGLTVKRYVLDETPLRVTGANSCFLASRLILKRLFESAGVPAGYSLRGCAFVHESADVAADARVEGPCLIGPGARIESRATIVGPTTIGSNCIIESDSIVCRSILWDDVGIGAAAFIDRCILTHRSFVASGQWSTGRIHHGMQCANGI
ncbi:MAG: NDP-sugar synthase [Phycisphaerales bacterium]|nr:NDP-sugar synthase [Phycisphaerales bacterium]MCB9856499.1 NDP-sugar synthase [Phycisphaerales bacterium]MCB9863980.1 NDP-sugar synthase [Phycisphaerales bacterium]